MLLGPSVIVRDDGHGEDGYILFTGLNVAACVFTLVQYVCQLAHCHGQPK